MTDSLIYIYGSNSLPQISCHNSRIALHFGYVQFASQTLSFNCQLALGQFCTSGYAQSIIETSSPNRRCVLQTSSIIFFDRSCIESARGDGKQISYSTTYGNTPYNFFCSGTAEKAYSGGKEINCPLSDDFFAEEIPCPNNCNNQGVCLGETTRKCYCFEGWTGAFCETKQISAFTFIAAEVPAFNSSSWSGEYSSSNGSQSILSFHILICLLTQLLWVL